MDCHWTSLSHCLCDYQRHLVAHGVRERERERQIGLRSVRETAIDIEMQTTCHIINTLIVNGFGQKRKVFRCLSMAQLGCYKVAIN